VAVTGLLHRPTGLAAGALVILAFVCGAACSHRSPYLRPGIPAPDGPLDEQVSFRLLLIGDAGEPTREEPVLRALRRWVQRAPTVTLVVFLGDNAYPEGMTPGRQADAEARISRQLAVVANSAAQALVVPGNHDWAGGIAGVRAQEAFVRQRAWFLPTGGCPGPERVDLPAVRPVVRVVALDTQWWLQEQGRPTDACPAGSPDAVVAQLEPALATDLPVVVVAHHPLASHGRHGGFFDWQDHVFPLTRLAHWMWIPLPGVGSFYPLFRRHVLQSNQDLVGALNSRMRAALETALSSRAGAWKGPLLYASGHDHSLQILEGRAADYLIVSGAGSSRKTTPVGHSDCTLFAQAQPGFVAVEVTEDATWVSVVLPDGGDGQVVFRVSAARR